MGVENPIRTLGDYSKPSHEGYRNSIELLVGNNVQREEINDRMSEMFRLLKELTTSRTPEKVLIREETKFSVTKNVNSISLARGYEEKSDKTDATLDNTKKPSVTKIEIPVKEAERNNETKNKPIKKSEKKEVEEVLSSRPVEYYLKHMINEKLIEELVDNNRFNDSVSRAELGSIGGLKHVDALVDQGSDVNVMPYSTYMNTDEMPTKTDIRLSLASHSYIYPLGIIEDVLVEASPGMERNDKASLGKGDGVQSIEEQKFQRQASHSYYNQGRNGR
ncbi:hypothetical protein Tco_0086249 [Tanacetum coccineum]